MLIAKKLASTLKIFTDRLSVRRDNGPLSTVSELQYFVSTRSSFVSQKTLYGYLKARMGTRYPSMFEDDVFVRSINIAKSHIFAACLSDLTIYVFANALADGRYDDNVYRKQALDCYAGALGENADGMADEFDVNEAVRTFTVRLATTDWKEKALTRTNFTESARAILHWAPIAPNLKKRDTDIVENSINFAWSEVRQNFLKRLDSSSVREDLAQISTSVTSSV